MSSIINGAPEGGVIYHQWSPEGGVIYHQQSPRQRCHLTSLEPQKEVSSITNGAPERGVIYLQWRPRKRYHLLSTDSLKKGVTYHHGAPERGVIYRSEGGIEPLLLPWYWSTIFMWTIFQSFSGPSTPSPETSGVRKINTWTLRLRSGILGLQPGLDSARLYDYDIRPVLLMLHPWF